MILRYLPKRKKELRTLIKTIRLYSQDIGMEFSIEKIAMFLMKSGKTETAVGIEVSS